MEPTAVNVLDFFNMGGMAALAAFAIWLNSKQSQSRIDAVKDEREREREDKLLLLNTVQANTEAMTSLKIIVDQIRKENIGSSAYERGFKNGLSDNC